MTLSETEAFLGQLTAQREHILGAIEGLDDTALRRPVLPSGWNCVGLVSHLAADVERQVSPGIAVEAVMREYQQQIELANAIISSTPLEAPPAWWPDFFGDWRLETLREILLHVLAETATHAGHLDAVRELIDGHTWVILT